MNRREMLKRVVGVGAVLSAAPVVAKLGASVPPNMNRVYGVSPVGPSPENMPLDVRTAEQVYEDETNDQVKRFLQKIEYPTKEHYFKYSDGMSGDVFDRLRAILRDRGISLPTQRFGKSPWTGKYGVVIDGSPVFLY